MSDSDLVADPQRARDGETWNDDVVEFFLKPKSGETAYGEFHVTAAGILMDALFRHRGPDAWAEVVHADPIRFVAAAVHTRDGYAVEAFVPWADLGPLGAAPQPGDRWRYNVARYDWTTGVAEPALQSLVRQRTPDFHRYEEWPALRFLGD